jgi:hypothetical protein
MSGYATTQELSRTHKFELKLLYFCIFERASGTMHSRTLETLMITSRRKVVKSVIAIPFLAPFWAGTLDAQTANGSAEPYPIPWLDKNGSHNQPAGPDLEPSHIFHFKGRVARSSTFAGMGIDNAGNRIAFGSPTTDYGVMTGEYWAARSAQRGTFTHI